MGEDLVCLQCYRAGQRDCTFNRVSRFTVSSSLNDFTDWMQVGSSRPLRLDSLCSGAGEASQVQSAGASSVIAPSSSNCEAGSSLDYQRSAPQVSPALVMATALVSDAGIAYQCGVPPEYAKTYASSSSSWLEAPATPAQDGLSAASQGARPSAEHLYDEHTQYHGSSVHDGYSSLPLLPSAKVGHNNGYHYNTAMADRALPPPTYGLVPTVFDFEYDGMAAQLPLFAGSFDLPSVEYSQMLEMNLAQEVRNEWRHC